MVVDEQHRFGVLQRFRLMKKPNQAEPDMLVMTATPIPRTLALSLYGDLDVSVLDELPPGRTPIVTRRVPGERSQEVWEFVRKVGNAGASPGLHRLSRHRRAPKTTSPSWISPREDANAASEPPPRKCARKGDTADLFADAAFSQSTPSRIASPKR